MNPGFWGIAIVVLLIVLLFGRGKISGVMGDVAKGIKSFKKGMADDPSDDMTSSPKKIDSKASAKASKSKKSAKRKA